MAKNPGTSEIRILVADSDSLLSRRLCQILTKLGFLSRQVTSGSELKEAMRTWTPDFMLVDLMLPEQNALSLLHELKAKNMIGESKIRVFIMSNHNHVENVKECLRFGASDFFVKPLDYHNVISRLIIYAQKKRSLKDVEAPGASTGNKTPDSQYYLHITDLALREALKPLPVAEGLHNLTKMLSLALHAVRVSIVNTNFEDRTGTVLASNDLVDTSKLNLDLNKYPEILYVLQSQKMLAIDNLSGDPTMAAVARQFKKIQFNSMIVCPIRINNVFWGVLSVRLPHIKQRLTDHEIRFAQIIGNIAGLVVQRSVAQATIIDNAA